MLVVIFVQIIHNLNSHDEIQKYAATMRLDTSPVALTLGLSKNVPFRLSTVNQFCSISQNPLPKQKHAP